MWEEVAHPISIVRPFRSPPGPRNLDGGCVLWHRAFAGRDDLERDETTDLIAPDTTENVQFCLDSAIIAKLAIEEPPL
jgi:hypothetical protein